MATLRINVYKCGGIWFGAVWRGNEYDSCDRLDVDDNATESEAIAAAALSTEEPCEVVRVDDLDTARQAALPLAT